jgi:hypothetical protein
MIVTFHDLFLFDSSLFADRKYSLLWRTYELFTNCAGAQLSTQANMYRKKYLKYEEVLSFLLAVKYFI